MVTSKVLKAKTFSEHGTMKMDSVSLPMISLYGKIDFLILDAMRNGNN